MQPRIARPLREWRVTRSIAHTIHRNGGPPLYVTDDIEVWNLTNGGVAVVGCLPTFNVVGRVADVSACRELAYRINGGKRRSVFVNRVETKTGRLWRPGEFAIDTLCTESLREQNTLELLLKKVDDSTARHRIEFNARSVESETGAITIRPGEIEHVEQVGQVVEGPWRVDTDACGEACIRILPEHAGYDRVLVFGSFDRVSGYELNARLSITAVTGPHNVGLVFKWNPHPSGDGTYLPRTWNTGLAYYCSYCPGLRLRYGVGVHVDENGVKYGDHVLAQAPLSTWRRRASSLVHRLVKRHPVTELALGRHYRFKARIHPRRYSLAVWRDGYREVAPQIVVDEPRAWLDRGPVGILAYRCAVNLYEYQVNPIDEN